MEKLFNTAIFNAPNGNMMKYTITEGIVANSIEFVPHTGLMKQYMDIDIATRIWNQYSEKYYWRINQSICGNNGEIFYDLEWFPMKGQICWEVAQQKGNLTIIYKPLVSKTPEQTKTTRSGKQY